MKPLDLGDRDNSQSFVESLDTMNICNGNVVTDQQGFAYVELAGRFELLNRDFRYQLTVVGQFAQAIVLRKLRGGQFVIKTDKPGVEVSWQVTGTRHDAWARAQHIPDSRALGTSVVGE